MIRQEMRNVIDEKLIEKILKDMEKANPYPLKMVGRTKNGKAKTEEGRIWEWSNYMWQMVIHEVWKNIRQEEGLDFMEANSEADARFPLTHLSVEYPARKIKK